MAQLDAGLTREAAFNLLSEHNHDPFHICLLYTSPSPRDCS